MRGLHKWLKIFTFLNQSDYLHYFTILYINCHMFRKHSSLFNKLSEIKALIVLSTILIINVNKTLSKCIVIFNIVTQKMYL